MQEDKSEWGLVWTALSPWGCIRKDCIIPRWFQLSETAPSTTGWLCPVEIDAGHRQQAALDTGWTEVLAVFPLWNNVLGQISDWDVSETQGPKIIFSF